MPAPTGTCCVPMARFLDPSRGVDLDENVSGITKMDQAFAFGAEKANTANGRDDREVRFEPN